MSVEERSFNDLRYWIGNDPSVLGGDVCGLRTPDKVSYFVCENSTDDGVNFDYPPFESGRMNGVLRLMTNEEAEDVYSRVEATLPRRKFASDMVEGDNDAVIALWKVDDEHSLMLIAEKELSMLRDSWYDSSRFSKVSPYMEGLSVSGVNFDANNFINLEDTGEQLSNAITQLSIKNKPKLSI